MDEKNTLKLSIDDLKGKQSVRATFRLPKEVIELLSLLAAQLGIKQKSLFDQLVEDPYVLSRVAVEVEAHSRDARTGERRQKTFVISRSSLDSLDLVARKYRIPRDLLVEVSIQRLLPLIESELEKHEKRKVILRELQDHLRREEGLLQKVEELLGKDDPLYAMIGQQVTLSRRHVSFIGSLVEKGRPMEKW